jgi:hypothetical protein
MAKSEGFGTSRDILDFTYESLERLRTGKTNVEQVRAEAAMIGQAIKIVQAQISSAKAAGTIKKGTRKIPVMEID